MGNVTTPEALSLRWAEVLNDPALRDLPYKVEVDAWGKIEMTPASNRPGRLQSLVRIDVSGASSSFPLSRSGKGNR